MKAENSTESVRSTLPQTRPYRGKDESHWALLALVRFFLALWVLLAHSRNFCPGARALPAPDYNAIVAVYCFFAISGYSICHSVQHNAKGYWSRRFWRIGPVYLTCLLIAACAYFFAGDAHKTLYTQYEVARLPGFLTWTSCSLLLQSIIPVYVGVIFPAWSLSIEVAYYTTALLLKRASFLIQITLLALSGIFCAYRVHSWGGYLGTDPHGIAILAMYWAWVAGWIAHHRPHSLLYSLPIGALGVLIIVLDPLHYAGFFMGRTPTLTIDCLSWVGTISLLFHADQIRLGERIIRAFSYLGELSYPLYLVHYPLFYLTFNAVFISHPRYNFPYFTIALALLVSALIYRFIDRPMRRGSERCMLYVLIGANLLIVSIMCHVSLLAFLHRVGRLF